MHISVVPVVIALALIGTAVSAQAPELQQQAMDLMPLADANGDGKVTLEEYQAFTEQGWGFVSQGADKVKVADLDDQAKLAFFGIQPDAQGYVTHKMYSDAAPERFKLFDADKNGSLNADELNGRALQQN
ncbi:MAG TPA: hypothetical protein VGE65_10080 [Sphingobium sp.]